MSAPCHKTFVLTVHWWINLVELILPNGLKGHLQHLQCLLFQNIHVIDGVYLQGEYALTI